MSLVSLHDMDRIYLSPVSPRQFGNDNWGKINRFDLVLHGPGVGVGMLFSETPIVKSFHMVFVEGVAWARTPFFAVASGKIRAGQKLWRCSNDEDLLHRLETDIRALHRSMQEQGFLTQERISQALARGRAPKALESFASADYHAAVRPSHNIKIGINENGDALFLDGRHRLAMAMTLGLRDIPARVVFRHERWNRLRDAILVLSKGTEGGRGSPAQVADHPDLEHLKLPQDAVTGLQERVLGGEFPAVSFRPAS